MGEKDAEVLDATAVRQRPAPCACPAAGLGLRRTSIDDVEFDSAQDASYAVHRVGVCGPLSTAAANEFMHAGYAAEDLGGSILAPEDLADGRGFHFLAIAGTVAYTQHDPRGFSSYAMRVLDVKTGETVWTSGGVYESTVVLRIADRPVSEMFRGMAADFAGTYPPGRQPGVAEAQESPLDTGTAGLNKVPHVRTALA